MHLRPLGQLSVLYFNPTSQISTLENGEKSWRENCLTYLIVLRKPRKIKGFQGGVSKVTIGFRVSPVMTTSIRLRMCEPRKEAHGIQLLFETGRPVMSCCGARKNRRVRVAHLIFFDRGHSFLLAVSAPGGARKRPHFDTSPYV